MRDSCGFALSVPGYMKRSCGFARIRPVPGRLWGVFNTPLHGDENVTRRMSLSVPDYVKRSCGFARIRPVPGRLWGVFCCAPTRGRKRYAQDVVIRARLRETFVRFCTYSSRSGSFVGRILLRPTRGYEMVMRNGGIRDRGHKIFMHIGLSLFFGR